MKERIVKKAIIPFIFLMLIINIDFEIRAECKGNILYVGGSGSNNYTSIQQAIENASNGDTIYVYSGIYYEHIVIDKKISLIGENKNTTIIDGDNAGDVVKIIADEVKIENFTIRGSGFGKGGIKIAGNNNIIKKCKIYDNHGGIVFSHSSNNVIKECQIYNNYNGQTFPELSVKKL